MNIKNLVFNPDRQIGFEIIDVDNNYARNKKNLSLAHRASFYCIIRFWEGHTVHQVDLTPIAIPENTFLFVNKDAIQLFDHQNFFRSQVLIFTDYFFSQLDGDHKILKTTPLFSNLTGSTNYEAVQANPELNQLWALMSREFHHSTDKFRANILKNYLHNFILIAEREGKRNEIAEIQNTIQLNYVLAFSEELEKHFKELRPVNFYSQKLSITDKILTNATKKIVGKTPKQIIDERTLLEVKRLLIYGGESGKSIAYILGFKEPTNLGKFFKRHTGKTLYEYRTFYSTQ